MTYVRNVLIVLLMVAATPGLLLVFGGLSVMNFLIGESAPDDYGRD